MDRVRIARQATTLAWTVGRGTLTHQRDILQRGVLLRASVRHASSTNKSKPIVLEQPDSFRPPSHGSKLVKGRSRGSTFNGAYNQGSTKKEQEQQKQKSYPHMFPDEGTLMYSFLTKPIWHVTIALTVLIFLAGVSIVQTFVKTSPFGHLMPPLSSLPFHPIVFFQDAWRTFRMHEEYNTETVEFARARKVLDAQKRRLYRRAHGMEDLDRDEDQGIDVRGIAPWDDGLTKREREGGGIGANRIKMISAMKVGADEKAQYLETKARMEVNMSEQEIKNEKFMRRKEMELGMTEDENPAVVTLKQRRAEASELEPWMPTTYTKRRTGQDEEEKEQDTQSPQAQQQQQQPQRKRKVWFGIW